MANTGFKGIDVIQTGTAIVFVTFLTTGGNALSTGTTTVELYELQDNGTVKSYDFADNTFKTTALTTATVTLVERTGNNSTTHTGLWTYALTTLTGFTVNAKYFAESRNSTADTPVQVREFQYGGEQGDLIVTPNGTGVGYLSGDAKMINAVLTTSVTTINANIGGTQPLNFTGTGGSALVQADTRDFLGQAVQLDANNLPKVDLVDILGVLYAGTAGFFVDLAQVKNPTMALALTNTTVNTVTTLTNLPAITANWLTAAGINAAALNGKGDWLPLASYVSPATPANVTAAQTAIIAAMPTPPSVIAMRTEMDNNSTKLANLDATITSRLPTSSYVSPPSAATVAATVATVLFVDGSTYTLKVNSDHSVNSSGGGGGGGGVVDSFTSNALLAMRNNLTGAVVTVRGPVWGVGGLLEMSLTVGDDFSLADSRQIEIDLDGTVLPDLTSATVQLRLSAGAKILVAGTVTVPTGSVRTVRFQPTSAQTGLLSPTVNGLFAVLITVSGRSITPEDGRGVLTVEPKIAP